MTTLNTRANQAWAESTWDPTEVNYAFEHQRAAFEEGWETGYKARSEELPTEVQIAEVVHQIFISGGAARTHAQEAASEIADAVTALFNGGVS